MKKIILFVGALLTILLVWGMIEMLIYVTKFINYVIWGIL